MTTGKNDFYFGLRFANPKDINRGELMGRDQNFKCIEIDDLSALEGTKVCIRKIVEKHDAQGILSILEEILCDGRILDGKALSDIPGTAINKIPSDENVQCCKELLVLCFNKDDLHDRLREMIYHAGVVCRAENRTVVFLTTKWEPIIFKKHEQAIQAIRQEGCDVVFILLTEKGASEIHT